MDFLDNLFKDEDSHAQFLKVYFSFGYYLGLIPYKFILVEKDGKTHYRAHGYFFNKIICALVHTTMFFQILSIFRQDLDPVPPPGHPDTLNYYFSLAFRLFSLPYYASYFHLFWTKKEAMISLLDELNSSPSRLETTYIKGIRLQVKTRAGLICSLYTFLAILSIALRLRSASLKDDSIELTKIIGTYAGRGRFVFFMSSNNSMIPPEDLNGSMIALSIFYIGVRYFSFLNGFLSDSLILMFALTFRSITIKFYDFIDSRNGISTSFVIAKHVALKNTVKNMNGILGMMYSFGLLVTYPTNVVYFASLSETQDDWFSIISNLFFAFNFVAVMVMCSRAVENIQRVAGYLRADRNRKYLSEVDFIVLLDDTRSFPFGIQGRGLAVVTYRYVRKILTNFLSYTLLLILFQYTRKASLKDCEACTGTETAFR